VFFDKQRATIGRLQNIFRYPYPGAIKANRLVQQRQDIQLGRHSGKGQNTIIICQCNPYIGLELEDAANQAQWASGIWSTLFSSRAARNKSRDSDPPMWSQL